MRRLLPLTVFALSTVFSAAYAQPANPPGQPPYAHGAGPRHGPQANNTDNCGTPDEPKPCPPLPRVPLKYYPANKQ
jgi:hypothetical protein